jgi:uncharacterized membrane protein YfcA
MDILTIAFIGFTFALAGLVKGVIGMGLPTVAMGLLAMQMSPGEAAALLIVPSFITNVWQAAGERIIPLLRRIWPLLACACAGTWGLGIWAGAGLLGAQDGKLATGALGAVLALYGVLGLTAVEVEVPARMEGWLSPLIVLVTGMVTAVTGIYMIPSVPYLQALGLQRDDLVQVLGIFFTASTLTLAVLLVRDGTLRLAMAGASLLALVPAIAGMLVGQWVRGWVRPAVFKTCFFAGALLLGLQLAWRAWG